MKKLVTLLCLFYCYSAFSQITPSLVRKALSEATGTSFPHLHDIKPVERFYQENEYRPVWLNDSRSILQKQLITLLYSAPEFGLDTKDYQLATLQELTGTHRIKDAADSAFTELILTDALLHFLKDLHSGTQPPLLAFEGYRAAPDPLKAITYLSTALEHESLEGLAAYAEPAMPAYQQAKRLLSLLSTTLNSADFTDILISSDLVSNTNMPLLTRLQQFGFLDSTHTISDKALVKKVQQAQLLFNLRNDGTLNPNTRAALNVSLRQRREEVKRALNLFRYIACLKEQGMAALVNIPSASLFVYQNDSLLLSSKIIAGKPSTPTPTLSSAITDVIVYPYWNVPHKIATRELLPQIKRNRSFLTSNGFEVLSPSGRVLDPSQINWHSLNSSNFPYTLRQSTGCDNALGVLKFNFYNPFTVYLHDTPYKGLFFLNKRFFSHGCMRVEKPIELSQLLLQEKASDIDTLIRTCLKDQKPHDITLEKPLPILVLYSTVWFNENGDVRFYEDVYHKNNFITNALVLDSITSSKQFLCLATKFIHSYSF